MSEELLEEWCCRVTDEAHVHVALAESGRSWEGAIRFPRGDLNRKPGDEFACEKL